MKKELSPVGVVAAITVVVVVVSVIVWRLWSHESPAPPLNPAVTGGAPAPGAPPTR